MEKPDNESVIPDKEKPFTSIEAWRQNKPIYMSILIMYPFIFASIARSCSYDQPEKPYKSPQLLEIEERQLEAKRELDEREKAIERARGSCEDSTLGESAILGERIRAPFIYDGMEAEVDNETLLCSDVVTELGKAKIDPNDPDFARKASEAEARRAQAEAARDHCMQYVQQVQAAMRSACETYHNRVPTVCAQGTGGAMECKPVKTISQPTHNPSSDSQPARNTGSERPNKLNRINKADRNK